MGKFIFPEAKAPTRKEKSSGKVNEQAIWVV
jgi:hypothetical protein